MSNVKYDLEIDTFTFNQQVIDSYITIRDYKLVLLPSVLLVPGDVILLNFNEKHDGNTVKDENLVGLMYLLLFSIIFQN